MNNVIKIKLLSDVETIAIFKLPKFNGLKPVRCEDCGHRADFARKVFHDFRANTNKIAFKSDCPTHYTNEKLKSLPVGSCILR